MWSTDPQENPPFHDFARVCSAIFCLYENENISTINSNSILNIITPIPLYLSSSPNQVYVPYCSSDLYVGTRDPSDEIRGFSFHGKYIVKVNLSMWEKKHSEDINIDIIPGSCRWYCVSGKQLGAGNPQDPNYCCLNNFSINKIFGEYFFRDLIWSSLSSWSPGGLVRHLCGSHWCGFQLRRCCSDFQGEIPKHWCLYHFPFFSFTLLPRSQVRCVADGNDFFPVDSSMNTDTCDLSAGVSLWNSDNKLFQCTGKRNLLGGQTRFIMHVSQWLKKSLKSPEPTSMNQIWNLS